MDASLGVDPSAGCAGCSVCVAVLERHVCGINDLMGILRGADIVESGSAAKGGEDELLKWPLYAHLAEPTAPTETRDLVIKNTIW